MAAEPPKTTLERISVEEKVGLFEPNRGKSKWFVCIDGTPMGPMYDFFPVGFMRNPYPFRESQIGCDTEEEGQMMAFRVMSHVSEAVKNREKILDENVDLRDCSWKYWTV